MRSPDVSRLSKPQQEYFKNIEMQDGKKGISSQGERNALAQALANGEITRQGVEYAQAQIKKFDLEEAKKNASDGLKKIIDNIMKITGDKHAIDSASELAALDKIINDPTSNPEDVAYAKAVRNMSQFAETTDLRNENTALRDENNGLRVENDELKSTLEDTQAELEKAQEELDAANETIEALKQDIDELKAENGELGAKLEKSMRRIVSLKIEKMKLGAKLKGYQDELKNGKISEEKFNELVEDIKKKSDKCAEKLKETADGVDKMSKLPEFDKILKKKPRLKDGLKGIIEAARIVTTRGVKLSAQATTNNDKTNGHEFGL